MSFAIPNHSPSHGSRRERARILQVVDRRAVSTVAGRFALRLATGLAAFFAFAALPGRGDAAEPTTPAAPNAERPDVRVALSQSQFVGVNQNDAHAAMKVYFKNIAEASGLTVDVTQLPMEGTRAIAEVLRDDRADFLVINTEEFLTLEDLGLVGPLLLSGVKKESTEEYVLLTHTESALRKVGDLKGHSLLLSSDVRASLARRWFEVLCREHGLGAPEQALCKITSAAKPTLVVLPVFFRQADACILTRHGFDVMGEMNPQVKKQLRVLAVSKPMVSSMSCWRRGFSESIKQRIIEAALKSQGKPAFAQVMVLFKCDGITQEPVSALDSARELLALHRRLCGAANSALVVKPNLAPGQPATQ